MITIQLRVPQEIGEIHSKPIVTKLTWETHRYGKAGCVKATFVHTEDLYCPLGTYLEIYEDQERILSYRIFERSLISHYLLVTAYDQLYHWVKSRESALLVYPGIELIHSYQKYLFPFDQNSWEHYQFIDLASAYDISGEGYSRTRGIFASDMILLFIRKYNLRIDSIYYGDTPLLFSNDDVEETPMDLVEKKVYEDTYGYPTRVTNKECVLDIIQYYIQRTILDLNRMFIL